MQTVYLEYYLIKFITALSFVDSLCELTVISRKFMMRVVGMIKDILF